MRVTCGNDGGGYGWVVGEVVEVVERVGEDGLGEGGQDALVCSHLDHPASREGEKLKNIYYLLFLPCLHKL